jgi:hypothetical protein
MAIDNLKAGDVTVKALVAAFWAGQPKAGTAAGIPLTNEKPLVADTLPPIPEERAGIDYYTAEMIYWTLDLAARLKWTSRSTDELQAIMNKESGQPDKLKTRFYLGGVEWKP